MVASNQMVLPLVGKDSLYLSYLPLAHIMELETEISACDMTFDSLRPSQKLESDQIKSNQSEQRKSNQIKSPSFGGVAHNFVNSIQIKSNQIKSNQIRAIKSNQNEIDQIRRCRCRTQLRLCCCRCRTQLRLCCSLSQLRERTTHYPTSKIAAAA